MSELRQPTGAHVTCCKPYFPVGARPVHSTFCPVSPNQMLTPGEAAKWRAERRLRRAERRLRHRPDPRPLTVRIVDDSDYMDFWSDRDDDEGA
jgi:hypothetical protein